MQKNILQRLAKPMLFLAALIWGASFFILKDALDTLPPFYLLAIRFTGGAVLLSLICLPRWKKFTADYLWRGAIIGAFLFSAYTVQTYGLIRTTPSKNAFLTAVYCVLVPFLYWLFAGEKPDRFHVIAAVLCVAGVGFVSLTGGSFTGINLGDLLTLCGALFYAAHIVAVAKVSPEKDIYLLTIFQFAFAALCCWIGSLFTETAPPLRLLLHREMLLPLLYLTVFATTVALLFQNVGQIWSDPSSASVILSLESVFGVLFSVLFYHDRVTAPMALGFVLIFLAVLCSETKFGFLRRKKKGEEASSPTR